jgi:regulator of sirC expression with transglutaminase-like and TPR domain
MSSTQDDISSQLAGLGSVADAEIDLAEAALVLAALDRPGRSLESYRVHLAELGSFLAREQPLPTAAHERAAALAATLAGHFGYAGDSETYDDMANANLMQVIDRRRGLPVALGILYIHLARSIGWSAEGVNFPGHFLVRISGSDGSALLDPFAGGRVIETDDLRAVLRRVGFDRDPRAEDLMAMGNREVLLRLQNNIKQRALGAGDGERAASVLGTMLLLAPAAPNLWLELSALMGELGSLNDAVRSAERAAEVTRDPAERRRAQALAASFRQKLN